MSVKDETEFDLQSWPFYWITRSNNAYLRTLEKVLKRNQLDVPRWRVLMLLHCDRARSVTYLAKEAIIKLPTMTRIVQRMEQEGLVRTRASDSDNRVTEVLLTANGNRAQKKAKSAAFSVFDQAFEGISEQKILDLNKTLDRVLTNLGDQN